MSCVTSLKKEYNPATHKIHVYESDRNPKVMVLLSGRIPKGTEQSRDLPVPGCFPEEEATPASGPQLHATTQTGSTFDLACRHKLKGFFFLILLWHQMEVRWRWSDGVMCCSV